MDYVIITGAAHGIGLALTKQAVTKDCKVLAIVRTLKNAQEILEMEKKSKNLDILEVDLTFPEAGKKISEKVNSWPKVDVVINNAGILREADSRKDFEQSFLINSIAPFEIVESLLHHLQKSPQPKTIQITSQMGSISDNTSGGYYSYRASKAALNMIVKSLSVDHPWLTSIVIHPGWVKTKMGGEQAPTTSEDSASGIWKVIESLKSKDSGTFLNYQGNSLDW